MATPITATPFDLYQGNTSGNPYDSGFQPLNPVLTTPLELWIDFQELTGQLRRQHLEVTRNSVIEIILIHTTNSPGMNVPAEASIFLSDVIDPNDPNHVPFDSQPQVVQGTITGPSTMTSFSTGPLGNWVDLNAFSFHDMHLSLTSNPDGIEFDYYQFTVTDVTGIGVSEDDPPPPNGDVPEPASMVLWGLGAGGLFLVARRRNRKAAA